MPWEAKLVHIRLLLPNPVETTAYVRGLAERQDSRRSPQRIARVGFSRAAVQNRT